MAKKVLFITSGMFKGGAETQLVKLALYLRSLNYTILLISLKPVNEFNIDYGAQGIKVLFLGNWSRYPFANFKKLYETVKHFKPDLVIAFMFIAIIFARLLKKLLGFKLISSIRNAELPAKWYVLFKLTSGLDDSIVYNSNFSKDNFESKRIVKTKGLVINNAILVPELQEIKKGKAPNETFVWVCVAHFKWNKDYNTLFKAISILKGENFRVDIVGEYTTQNDPGKLIEQLNIQQHVNILGFKPNAAPYLNEADAFVLSSHVEGMPNALLEAMAHSKPVVVTDIGCNNEVLNEAGCGFLSKIENEEHLARMMLLMMKMPAHDRNVLGENGRRYIQKNFSESKVMRNWLSVIDQHIALSPAMSSAG